MSGAARTWLGVVAALTLAACPGTHHDPPADAHTTAESVLELARTWVGGGPDAAVLEARASQYSEQGGLKGKVLILARRPGHLRMEGLSPTDDSVSVLATDGERFTSWQRGQSTCWVGRACPDNVGRFASVPLEADELVGVLLGRPPLIPHEHVEMKWDDKVGAYRLELVGGGADLGLAHGRTQRLWVAHADGRVVRTQLLEGGRRKVDVRYSEFRRVAGELVPGRLDVLLERDETDLRLEYREIDLATVPADEAFTFTCPAGTTLEELPCSQGTP